MSDELRKLADALKAVDHMSVEDCFLQSPLFEKAAAATVLDFHARKDGTSTEKTSASSTLVDDTYTIIGFTVDDLGNIMPYQDGAALTSSAIVAGTANIPSGAADVLQPMIEIGRAHV